tara:strand:+ start:41 stop:580 length:540 start_codon:yes stop_codon:yes gene_type:complete
MALESLNQKSKIVVHNSATDLVDKTPLEAYQGVAVEDVAGFEKITYAINPDGTEEDAVYGESVVHIQGNGVLKRFVCVGEYGSTLAKGTDILSLVTTNVTNGTNGTALNAVLSGGSGSGASVNFTVVGNTVDTLNIRRTGINYKADDVLTFTVPGASSPTDVTIELDQTILNNSDFQSI